MLGFGRKQSIEDKMAEWLAHPNEFGVPPQVIEYTRTYKGVVMGHGIVEIHLVDYKMPDGTIGRGFVNGPLTWSFLGNDVNSITDEDLLTAYCGWAWLFPALQGGVVQTEFVSQGEEEALIAKMQSVGLENIELNRRYKISDIELFEFSATKQGKRVRGAGNVESSVLFEADDARTALPAIYFLLGSQAILKMQ